ncbi:MAG: nucleotidyltransferase family protein, partial [Gaiellaceae bacterium]
MIRNASIRSILLRGPAFALWLYQDGTRSYSDVDLLVAPEDFERAERVLSELGFARSAIPPPAGHAQLLSRSRDSAAVDLHRAIVGIGVPENEAWSVLAACTEAIPVGGADVDVLRPHARAMVVVLHAAQHGVGKPKPLEDLSRVLGKFTKADWRAT